MGCSASSPVQETAAPVAKTKGKVKAKTSNAPDAGPERAPAILTSSKPSDDNVVTAKTKGKIKAKTSNAPDVGPERAPAILTSRKSDNVVTKNTMSSLETGTKLYMSLYPERSTDGILYLGNLVPDFGANTMLGPMPSFHKWKKDKWAILFLHPVDFIPVCTTEIGSLATKYDELTSMDCLIANLSVEPVKSDTKWLLDVIAHHNSGEIEEEKIEIKFPIIVDSDRGISTAFGMIDPWSSDRQSLPLTIRAIFIINPDNKLMLTLHYPACVGRNMNEVVRCVKALQLSYGKSVATPANWPDNHAKLRLADGTYTSNYKGSVFLLPTVSDKEAKTFCPHFHTCEGCAF